MGMLIDGTWHGDADRSMVDGTYRREISALQSSIDAETLQALAREADRFYLIASASCPWSHGAVLALILGQLGGTISIQWAGGPRIEGYGLKTHGPLIDQLPFRHVHQFYTATDATYTGRATVPVLWDTKRGKILSNSSQDIIAAFNQAGRGPDLVPNDRREAIQTLTQRIFDGLSNAVYRAGKAERQDEYDDAVNSVFHTMDLLEDRLADQVFLFGDDITLADIRLFATLVRFDTVYVTHFRCTRKRLVEYPNLWRFTRRIYQMPGIAETVDFDEIRYGYYINDGSHNPHGIIGQQPEIDWLDRTGLAR